nr:extracellular solute-binding protein [Mesorhizobium sp.]
MNLLKAAALAAAIVWAIPSQAQEWRTGSALVNPSKYGGDFKHYDYVNPEAPRTGTINRAAIGTFNSFNPFIIRGAAAAGLSQSGGMLYDTLMAQSPDEPGVAHPLIAEALKYPDDFSSVTYRLNANARWHDGTPITAEDVVWSFEKLKELSPLYVRYYANVTGAKALNDREIEFTFNQKGNRELPAIIGDLAVLPKHWWEGKDANGKQRNIAEPTLEPPLGSGAYRIESFNSTKDVTWLRVEDYWAKDLPVNVGRHNFERQHFSYFLDEAAVWQAFTKGGISDVRIENRARRWANDYTFPAFTAGDVIKAELPVETARPMQGYVFNARLPKFSDRRVRQALTLAFDFESLNRTTFEGLYRRTDSYFEGTELASSGLPEGKELEILKQYEKDLPPEVFTQEFKLPVYDTREAPRTHLREAARLLQEAGWERRGGRLVDAKTGEPFTIEFLGDDPSDDRVVLPYVDSLKNLGIQASLRIVDAGQYENRKRSFNYEMILDVFAQSSSPGNEQRNYWSSKAADAQGSDNTAGVRNPVVDALVERVIFTTDRADLVAATRALDRVLLWNFYMVPQWHNPNLWVAYWNRLGKPDKQPAYVGLDLDSWWIDAEKDKAFAAKYQVGR